MKKSNSKWLKHINKILIPNAIKGLKENSNINNVQKEGCSIFLMLAIFGIYKESLPDRLNKYFQGKKPYSYLKL